MSEGEEIRAYRAERFVVEVATDRYQPGAIQVSHTTNGYQFNTWSLYPEEWRRIIATVQAELDKPTA